MTNIVNNQRVSVLIVDKEKEPIIEKNGNLIGDSLNIVSPSYRGKAFIPVNIENNLDLSNHLGNERKNMYGHTYDQLHYYIPNQGFDAINTWIQNGGENAVHTRILGIGTGIKNSETGKYPESGFKVSAGQGVKLIFTSFEDDERHNDYVKELLGNEQAPNSDYLFLSHFIMTDSVNDSILIADDNQQRISYHFSNNNTKQFGFGLQESVLNKKPTNSKSKFRENIFSTEFDRDSYFIYTKFKKDLSRRKKIIHEVISVDDDPSFRDFNYPYTTAKTPWVTSQPINRTNIKDNRLNMHEYVENLFRFHALDDGEIGNRYKIKVNPNFRGNHTSTKSVFSSFDIFIFEYDARVNQFLLLESFLNLNLDSNDKNYICRRIGTKNKKYDLETKKIYIDGKYDNVSSNLWVEINPDIEFKKMKRIQSIVPSGFRAYPHIDCSLIESSVGNIINALPVKYYERYNSVSEIDSFQNTWGVKMYNVDARGTPVSAIDILEDKEGNKVIMQRGESEYISHHYFHTKFFNSDIWVEDDSYLNNYFNLEKIAINNKDITTGVYKDSGSSDSLTGIEEGKTYEYLNLDVIDFKYVKGKLSFDFFTYGGFDGNNILDFDKKYMTNKGIIKEFYDENNTSLYTSYTRGIDQITKYENNNGTILGVPDISTSIIHNYCINRSEALTRYVYIGDIKDYKADSLRNSNSEIDYYRVSSQLDSYSKDRIVVRNYNLLNSSNKVKELFEQKDYTGIDSKYFFNIIGDNSVVIDGQASKYVSPVTIVSGILAIPGSKLVNVTSLSPEYSSSLGKVSSFTYIDINKLKIKNNYQDEDSEDIGDDLFSMNINAFTSNGSINNTEVGLNTCHMYTGQEFTINNKLNVIRTIQHIKNRIMIDLYTNESVVKDTVLFNVNSKLNEIYQKVKIQLTLLMSELKSEGYITDYLVNIDNINTFDDVVNQKIKGNIVIQIGESNIIELDINNVLSELNETMFANSSVEIPRLI